MKYEQRSTRLTFALSLVGHLDYEFSKELFFFLILTLQNIMCKNINILALRGTLIFFF